MRLHFIGVGKMGLPMAQHLRASGAESAQRIAGIHFAADGRRVDVLQ